MKFPLFAVALFLSASAFGAEVHSKTVRVSPLPTKPVIMTNEDGSWTQQCSFEFKQWVGDAYVDTVDVYTQETWDGSVATQVVLEGLQYTTDGCTSDNEKHGTLRTRVESTRPRLYYVDTGDLAWATPNVAYQFSDYKLPNCWRATVTTTAWCAAPDDGSGSN